MVYNMKNNKRKIILFIILGIIIVLFAVMGTLYEKNEATKNFLDKYIFLKEKHENNLPFIAINGAEEHNIYAFKENIYILKDNNLKIYNKNGSEEGTLEVSVSNPIFQSDGDYLCIVEKNGKKLYVFNNKNILWQKDFENNISDIEINSNGYLAVSLTGTIYKTIIQVFDNKGKDLFTTFISSTYVVDMELSEDNKYLAIAEANFSGIILQSNVKIISIDKAKSGDKDYVEYTFSNKNGDLITNIKYQTKYELSCVFDNHIELINKDVNSTISNFEKEDVLFVDVNNKIIKIIKEQDKIYLQILNNSGLFKNYEVKEPKSMYISNEIIALNLGSEVLFYNNSGWLIKKYYASQEINNIVLCDGLAGIVYNEKIELISL